MLGPRPATRIIGSSRAATAFSVGLRLATDSIGPLSPSKLSIPFSLTRVDSITVSLFFEMVAVLASIALRFF